MEIEPSLHRIMSSDSHPVKSIHYMDAALYDAAEKGNMQVFNKYQGFELESLRTPDNNTVLHLHLATPEFRGLSEFIQQILNKCPALLLQANTRGQTPLHVAARYGSYTVVKFLIQFQEKAGHGDVEQQETAGEAVRRMPRNTDLESNTPLHIASQYSHRGVVQELLEFEDPDFPYSSNRKQESPLYIAARRGDGPLLDMIFEKLKSVAHGGPHGRTALHAAAMVGDANATRIILEKKKKLTKERDEDGLTPLHYAAHLGHFSVVEVLLKWDISAAYVTDKKWEMTPILMAARQGHGRIVTKFLSICPDCCEKVDKTGWNLLHFVAFRKSPSRLSDTIFKHGNVVSQRGSVRNLMEAEDAHGITPQQVYDASCENGKPNKKKEQIDKLLEDILNEEVSGAPVRPLSVQTVTEEVAEDPDLPVNLSTDSFEKARDAHLIVGTLVATVTFTAAITVPGGFKSEEGKEQGTPFLIHDAAFKAFVVSNALAFILSFTTVSFYFHTLPPYALNPLKLSVLRASKLLSFANSALMVAFSTGTYTVLKPSPGLAITSFCIGLDFVFYRIFTIFLGLLFAERRNQLKKACKKMWQINKQGDMTKRIVKTWLD